jgi:hypothetical protein
MLRVSIGIAEARSEIVESFFEEDEGCFSESRMVLLGNWSVYVGASSPVSSTNLDEFHSNKSLDTCWRIKDVWTYDPQAYGPTPFSPRDSLGSCQSAEQGDYKRLIYLHSLTYPNPNLWLN